MHKNGVSLTIPNSGGKSLRRCSPGAGRPGPVWGGRAGLGVVLVVGFS